MLQLKNQQPHLILAALPHRPQVGTQPVAPTRAPKNVNGVTKLVIVTGVAALVNVKNATVPARPAMMNAAPAKALVNVFRVKAPGSVFGVKALERVVNVANPFGVRNLMDSRFRIRDSS